MMRGLDIASKINAIETKYPQTYCKVCEDRTPHQHERRSVEGRLVVRRLCLTCKSEEPKQA
jgi:hypothetical protein